jgi:hypothetical protein
MKSYFKIICYLIFFIVVTISCVFDKGGSYEIPEHILEINNLVIFSPEEFAKPDTVRLIRDQVFGDTDEVYIGRVREFISDESGRVYVIDSAMGARAVHAYESDGSYIAKIGRMGRGPGEYLNPCCMKIRSNRLYVFDHGLARLTIFSTHSWDVLETISMDRNQMGNGEKVLEKRFTNYYFLDDEMLLLAFIRPQQNFEDEPGSIHYYTSDPAFQQLGEEVLEQDQILEVWGEWNEHRLMKYYPFYSKPLITVTPSGRIFVADSGEFLVRELNREGYTIGGFYVPINGVPLNRDEAFGEIHEMERDIANNAELPNRWPVMKSMWSDNQGRLWLSTFTEIEDELEWWVIDPDDGVTARFRWPGDRNAYPLNNGRTFKHINGDYFYTREDDDETGLQTVVRYRIEFE